jgi:glycine/D-amino acid oxidase-like deaminating enzyme
MPHEKNLWISAAFQGHGMVLCIMCAKALVAMMCGDDKDDNLSWFPDAFRVTEKRVEKKFCGRLHTKSHEKDPGQS